MLYEIPAMEIEALDVGYAIRFVGDEKRSYWAPGAPTPLLMLSMRLSMLGLKCNPALDLKMHVGAADGATETASGAQDALPHGPVLSLGDGFSKVATPADATSIERADAMLTDVATAPAFLRELFGTQTFTSTSLADATGILASRCSSILSRLSASGVIARGERRKDGIQYTVPAAVAIVKSTEFVTPPGDYSEPYNFEPGSSAPALPEAPEAAPDVEFVRAVSEPAPEPELVALYAEAPEHEPAPEVDTVVASLRNQANVCLAAGWSRDKAIASMTSMSNGTVPADVINSIATSVFGDGAEPKAPF